MSGASVSGFSSSLPFFFYVGTWQQHVCVIQSKRVGVLMTPLLPSNRETEKPKEFKYLRILKRSHTCKRSHSLKISRPRFLVFMSENRKYIFFTWQSLITYSFTIFISPIPVGDIMKTPIIFSHNAHLQRDQNDRKQGLKSRPL